MRKYLSFVHWIAIAVLIIAWIVIGIHLANVKHFFTSLGNEFFTSSGKQFLTLFGNEFFTLPGKEFFTSRQVAGKAGRYLVN